MRKLREILGVSRRTVERWRAWWRETFAESPFWRITSAAFMPPLQARLLPVSLLERFSGDDESRLVGLLRLLRPITGGAGIARPR
jgi:Homeodomain-like domain